MQNRFIYEGILRQYKLQIRTDYVRRREQAAKYTSQDTVFLFAEVKRREQDETKIFGGNHVDSYSYSASTKVSAVTSAKCKALKSSKWVYSKKYKRLILKKNNKEAQKQM